MAGKVLVKMGDNYRVDIECDLGVEDLYKAYVALTAHIASKMKEPQMITDYCSQASDAALKLVNEKMQLAAKTVKM